MRPDDHWYIGGLGIPKPHRLPAEEWISILIGTAVFAAILWGWIYVSDNYGRAGVIWYAIAYLVFGYFFVVFGIGFWRPWWQGAVREEQSKKASAVLFVIGFLIIMPMLAVMWPYLIGMAIFDRPVSLDEDEESHDYSENGNHA